MKVIFTTFLTPPVEIRRRGLPSGWRHRVLPCRPSRVEALAVPNCPRCLAFSGNKIFHLDCQRTRDLSMEERVLLFRYCHDHAVAKCVACEASFRQEDLDADFLGNRSHLCPRCRADLTPSMRTHLYTCTILPHAVRQRAQAVRHAAQILVKESGGLRDQADVLMRVAEAATASLRETMAKAAATESRRQTEDRRSGSK